MQLKDEDIDALAKALREAGQVPGLSDAEVHACAVLWAAGYDVRLTPWGTNDDDSDPADHDGPRAHQPEN